MAYEIFEDKIRTKEKHKQENRYSPFCDVVYYNSTINKELSLGVRVLKPETPSYILVTTHGWHMNMPEFEYLEEPDKDTKYLTLEVDMRGRAYSQGQADCNGWELYDVIDAVNFVREKYKEYILNPEIVYFDGGSGGGGNAYSIVSKFPDFFAAATALCGITDYEKWYEQDSIGEFRDELDVWVGCSPLKNPTAYKSRSGLYSIQNLLTHLFIAHGETDLRIPITQAREYVAKAEEVGKGGLVKYLELKGVGTRNHWGNASEAEIMKIKEMSEENRILNKEVINIPQQGEFVIAGYLLTKKFSVILDSLDKMATIKYDLKRNMFNVICEESCKYKLEVF